MYPVSFEQTLGCLGTARFSGKSVRISPIGLNVTKFCSLSFASASIDRTTGCPFFCCSLHPLHLKSVNKFFIIFKSVWWMYDNEWICFLKKQTQWEKKIERKKVKANSYRKFLISLRATDNWFCNSIARFAVISHTKFFFWYVYRKLMIYFWWYWYAAPRNKKITSKIVNAIYSGWKRNTCPLASFFLLRIKCLRV